MASVKLEMLRTFFVEMTPLLLANLEGRHKINATCNAHCDTETQTHYTIIRCSHEVYHLSDGSMFISVCDVAGTGTQPGLKAQA